MPEEELQAGQLEETPVATEQPNEVSESAPESGQSPKVEFNEEQQAVFDKAMGDRTLAHRRTERDLEGKNSKLAQDLADAQSKIPQDARPLVPDAPDPYDEDFAAKLAVRDDAIQQAAAFDARSEAQVLINQQEANRANDQKQQALAKTIQTYSDTATKLGVDAQELQQAGAVVSQYGVSDDIASFILNDEQGPLITKYLAINPAALEKINSLDPMSAAVFIATDVKQQATQLGVKNRNAPDPTDTLSGAGVSTEKRGPKGATFE